MDDPLDDPDPLEAPLDDIPDDEPLPDDSDPMLEDAPLEPGEPDPDEREYRESLVVTHVRVGVPPEPVV